MQTIFKITRKDGDSVEATMEKGIVIIKVDAEDSENEYVVLDKVDFEAIIFNYLHSLENKVVPRKIFNLLFNK